MSSDYRLAQRGCQTRAASRAREARSIRKQNFAAVYENSDTHESLRIYELKMNHRGIFFAVARAPAFVANQPPSKRTVGGESHTRRNKKMFHRGKSFLASLLVALVLAIPLAAAADTGAKPAATITTTMDFLRSVTLGGKQLKPGSYHVKATETTVTLEQNGKVVAEAPVQWKDENRKPIYSNIVSSGDQVTELHFAGKMKYAVVGG
jgi:hypothetical protein